VRWKNGGPPKLYVVVDNTDGSIITYDRLSKRRAAFKKSHEKTLDCVLLTYVQQEK
jgi:uncharacterized protein YodC (DUF2158 family)